MKRAAYFLTYALTIGVFTIFIYALIEAKAKDDAAHELADFKTFCTENTYLRFQNIPTHVKEMCLKTFPELKGK